MAPRLIASTTLLAAALGLASSDPVARWIGFDRERIVCGEVWRIVTGGLVHHDRHLLLVDGAALLVLWILAARCPRLPATRALAWSAVGSGLGVLALHPGIATMEGASGLASGLFAAFAVQLLRTGSALQRTAASVALVGFVIKVALEAVGPGHAGLVSDARVLWGAHAAGAALGGLSRLPFPWRASEGELRAFLACGDPAHGFCRIHCPGCASDLLVPFSCKGRAFCPSCGGRRMAGVAAPLVDRVLHFLHRI